MLDPKDLQAIARTCTSISNEVGEPSGFVPIRRLLERFDLALHIRPLLVEGMLASISRGPLANSKLAVLVDSETYEVDNKDVALEAEGRPLPTRFRSTVAHELLHSLAFRPHAFGLRLQQPIKDEKGATSLVRAIETETERLTPLLLWPEKSLDTFLSMRDRQVSAGELANLAIRFGLSRAVVINRLRLRALKEAPKTPWLQDVAIGVAEWGPKQRALFRKWPLFINFDRNIVPAFIHDISSQDRLPASSIFDNEHLALIGGDYSTMSFRIDAGLKDARAVERMPIVVSIEDGDRKQGQEFFFVVRKKWSDDKDAPATSIDG